MISNVLDSLIGREVTCTAYNYFSLLHSIQCNLWSVGYLRLVV